MLLAIDTATRTAGIALYDGAAAQLRAELSWTAGQQAVTQLMNAIEHVLALEGLDRAAISSVAVTTGPGSFNGVRIGVTSAKGIAWSLDLPLVGIGTLEAAAYQHADLSLASGMPLMAVVDAGRGQVAVAVYEASRQAEGWHEVEPPRVVDPATLIGEIRERRIYICGEVSNRLAEGLGETAVLVARPAERLRRAGALAALAFQRLAEGKTDNPATLVPVYLQRPPVNPNNPAARTKQRPQE